MRVVIDSSVVVAALTPPNPESASQVVLAAVAAGAVEYPQVRRYTARVDRQRFVGAIVASAERVEANSAPAAVSAEPGGDKVVAAALAGRAALVVTLGRHLLEIGGLAGVLILRPGEFWRELRTQT